MNIQALRKRTLGFGFVTCFMVLVLHSAAALEVRDTNGVVTVAASACSLEIINKDFRYGFVRADGTVISPPNAEFGLEFDGGRSVSSKLVSAGTKTVLLEVANDNGEHARVEVEPGDHFVRFSVTQSQTNRIVARVGGISPAFGRGAHVAFGTTNTEVTGFYDGHFRAQEPPGKTLLFAGGKGVVVTREISGPTLRAAVYPVAPPGSACQFTHRDGKTRSIIACSNSRWADLRVLDTTDNRPVAFGHDGRTQAVSFDIAPGHNYRI